MMSIQSSFLYHLSAAMPFSYNRLLLLFHLSISYTDCLLLCTSLYLLLNRLAAAFRHIYYSYHHNPFIFSTNTHSLENTSKHWIYACSLAKLPTAWLLHMHITHMTAHAIFNVFPAQLSLTVLVFSCFDSSTSSTKIVLNGVFSYSFWKLH